MLLIVVVLLLSAAVTYIAVASTRIHRQKLRAWSNLDRDGVERGLRLLLKCGYDGGHVILTDLRTQRFVQFRKYIGLPGVYGLEMHFPRAPWSQQFYSDVEAVLRQHGIETKGSVVQGAPLVEILEADFGHQGSLAADIVDDITKRVFGLAETKLQLTAADICPVDDLVDRKDYPRPSALLRDQLQKLHQRWRKRLTF